MGCHSQFLDLQGRIYLELNVIAYWSRGPAPTMNGTKHDTEAVGAIYCTVGERCVCGEGVRTTSSGANASDYAGMSRR